MCVDPATATLVAAGISAAVGTYGAYSSAQASKSAANAVAAQNQATTKAQNTAFDQRLTAQSEQGDAQYKTYLQEIADRSTNAQQLHAGQTKALSDQQQVIDAENRQQEAVRAAADQQAQGLLSSTSGQALSQGQQDAQARQEALLAGQVGKSDIASPDATDPNAGSTGSNAAYKQRMAQAATSIRDYGSKIATTGSYAQPISDIGSAIAANKVGIMPAAAASDLLKSGAGVRLLPSQLEYSQAGDIGSATDQLIQSRAQGALTLAGLKANDSTALATLGQSDTDTIAANKTAQAKADADYAKSVGNVISGIGNLGLYGAGYLGGNPLKTGSTIPSWNGTMSGGSAMTSL